MIVEHPKALYGYLHMLAGHGKSTKLVKISRDTKIIIFILPFFDLNGQNDSMRAAGLIIII